MADYIEREAFLKNIEERYCTPCKAEGRDYHGVRCRACWVDDMRGEVMDEPAAFVKRARRGWWVGVDSSYWRWTPSGGVSVAHITYRCGRCGRGTAIKTHYCPNCGARMDVEDENDD